MTVARGWTYDSGRRLVHAQGRTWHLSQMQYDILDELVAAHGACVDVRMLRDRLGLDGWNDRDVRRALRDHVRRLRDVIGAEAITNVRGHGYALDMPSLAVCEHCGRYA